MAHRRWLWNLFVFCFSQNMKNIVFWGKHRNRSFVTLVSTFEYWVTLFLSLSSVKTHAILSKLLVFFMDLKIEPDIKPFFFNFRFNSGFFPVLWFLTDCWPVLRVLTGLDWLPVSENRSNRPVRFLKQWFFFFFFS